jgi:glucose 1-dehydrogenase
VAVNDVAHADECSERVAEIESLGRRAAFIHADVSKPDECVRLVAQTVQQLGGLDIFCANAGVAHWEELVDVSPQTFAHIVGVNLHGVFFGCQAAAAHMRRQGCGGRIVVTSSVHAVTLAAKLGIYGATKHAVAHLVGVMAREWAQDDITVNHVGPGWVESDINDRSPDFATDELRARARAIVPLGHAPVAPEAIGEAVAYFASPGSAQTTGTFLRVDRGMVIGKY